MKDSDVSPKMFRNVHIEIEHLLHRSLWTVLVETVTNYLKKAGGCALFHM